MDSYTIHLYPSLGMEDHYTTWNPVLFLVLMVLTYACTAAVFLTYDRCVEQRQRKVMLTAVQSSANVSLLESMVQERTRKLASSNAKLEAANRKIQQASAAQLKHFACMSHEIVSTLWLVSVISVGCLFLEFVGSHLLVHCLTENSIELHYRPIKFPRRDRIECSTER